MRILLYKTKNAPQFRPFWDEMEKCGAGALQQSARRTTQLSELISDYAAMKKQRDLLSSMKPEMAARYQASFEAMVEKLEAAVKDIGLKDIEFEVTDKAT